VTIAPLAEQAGAAHSSQGCAFTSPGASISTETEIKLAARQADLPVLRRVLHDLATGASAARSKLVSTYYDTEDRALARQGSVLRVRRDNGHFIQTVKSAAAPGDTPLARGEWEDTIAGERPDPGAGESGRFLTADIADRVAPVFQTEVTRLVTDLSPAPGTRIEAAIDRGTIRAPGGKPGERISEIELELKSGPVTALYDVALRLLAEAPVRLEWRSKAERGYRLAAGYPITQAARANPCALDPGLSAEEALQRIGRVCLDQILRNEAAIFAGRSDGIHQMRVAVRRLRAVLSAFRKMLPPEQRRWASGELRWLAGALGDARNLDVFDDAVIRPAREALPDVAALRVLSAAARRRRQSAYAAARQRIGSPRYTALLLGLMRWFDGCGWRGGERARALEQPIVDIAPPLLDRLRREAKRRGKGFARQPAEARHKLRIALKKLRYTSELLSGLYDAPAVDEFTARLKRLQDDLGDANDVRAAQDILAELAHGKDRATIARAGKIVLDWHRHRLIARQPETKKNLRRLMAAEPFWRG
jgi:triphosphatase